MISRIKTIAVYCAHIATLLALHFGAATLLSTPASADDLLEIYNKARVNDETFKQAAQNRRVERLTLPLAKTAFRPNLSGSAGLAKQRDDSTGTQQTRNTSRLSLNLGVSAYNKPNRIAIDQARHQVSAAEMQYQSAEHDLVLRVAERYFNVLAAQDNHEVARLQKISIGRQMDLAQERLDVGLGTRTDLYDASARYQQADSDLITAQNLIDNSLQQLREIAGDEIGELATLSIDAPLNRPQPDSLDAWLETALQNNLSLQAQLQNEAVARLEIDRQKTARWPQLDANITDTWSDRSSTLSSSINDQNILNAGITLTLPIYSGGAIGLNTRRAGLSFSAQQHATESLRRQIVTLTTAAFLDVTSGISRVRALSEAVKAGSNALKAKEEGYSAGLTTNLDVLDAQRDLSRFKTDYLVARYNYILSVLRLDQTVADLNETDVRLINSWLQE